MNLDFRAFVAVFAVFALAVTGCVLIDSDESDAIVTWSYHSYDIETELELIVTQGYAIYYDGQMLDSYGEHHDLYLYLAEDGLVSVDGGGVFDLNPDVSTLDFSPSVEEIFGEDFQYGNEYVPLISEFTVSFVNTDDRGVTDISYHVTVINDDTEYQFLDYTSGENQSSPVVLYKSIDIIEAAKVGGTFYVSTGAKIAEFGQIVSGMNGYNIFWGSGVNLYTDHGILACTDDTFDVVGTYTEPGEDLTDAFVTDCNDLTIVVVDAAPLDFTSPDAVEAVSGSTISYTAATNIPATFSEVGGSGASWLEVDASTGKVTGQVPTIEEKTTFTYQVKATSTGDSTNTTTQTITIVAYPVAQITSSNLSVTGIQGNAIIDVNLTGNLGMTFDVSSGTLPEGLSLSEGVISGTPTGFGQSTVTIKGTTTEGPVQNPTIQISFDFEEKEPELQVSAGDYNEFYVEGSSISIPLTSNVDGTEWTVTGGTASGFLSVADGSVVGSIPMTYDEITEVTLKVSAETPQGQTDTVTITFDVEPTIQFTTVPTADCIIVPVYTYNPDGTPVLSGGTQSLVPEVDAAGADFQFADTLSIRATFTGQNATSVIWYWGDGSVSPGNVVEHTYAEAGEYTVTLYVQGENDAEGNPQYDTMTLTVQVGEPASHDLFFIAVIVVLVIAIILLVVRVHRRRNLY